MIKVRTFTQKLEIFKTMHELHDLDEAVNKFIQDNNVTNVISVSDSTTTDDNGETIGIIRVLTYKSDN